MSVIGKEGWRLFFSLAALHAALWPAWSAAADGLKSPTTSTGQTSPWLGGELLFGGYGAVLIGFVILMTPKWSEMPPPPGWFVALLAALWGIGRLAIPLGGTPTAMADPLWLAMLTAYVAGSRRYRPRLRLSGLLFWLSLPTLTGVISNLPLFMESGFSAEQKRMIPLLAFTGLLGLILARIAVPLTNRILDPSRKNAPYRPCPSRRFWGR